MSFEDPRHLKSKPDSYLPGKGRAFEQLREVWVGELGLPENATWEQISEAQLNKIQADRPQDRSG